MNDVLLSSMIIIKTKKSIRMFECCNFSRQIFGEVQNSWWYIQGNKILDE